MSAADVQSTSSDSNETSNISHYCDYCDTLQCVTVVTVFEVSLESLDGRWNDISVTAAVTTVTRCSAVWRREVSSLEYVRQLPDHLQHLCVFLIITRDYHLVITSSQLQWNAAKDSNKISKIPHYYDYCNTVQWGSDVKWTHLSTSVSCRTISNTCVSSSSSPVKYDSYTTTTNTVNSCWLPA